MNWTFWTRTPPTIPDDCETIDPLLSLYADGMALPEESLRVEAHLLGCAACRESLAWMRATRFALAARPVALPPADLRARIAEAIAASSAATVPVTFRTRRAFALRPVLAAAASFAMLGIVSYGLLHHPPPAAVQSVVPPLVASVPHPQQLPPVVKAVTAHGVIPHVVRRPSAAPQPARLDTDRVARIQPEEAVPAPVVKTHTKTKPETKMLADAVPVKALPIITGKQAPRKPRPEMLATNKGLTPPAETHKVPVLKPEPKSVETAVAEVPHTRTPFVPTIIEKLPVITQDPVPTVAVASDGGGHLQTAENHRIIGLHNVVRTLGTFTRTSIARLDSVPDKGGRIPLVYTP